MFIYTRTNLRLVWPRYVLFRLMNETTGFKYSAIPVFFILKQFIWLWATFTDCSFANMRTFKHQIMTLVSNNNYNIGLVIVEWEWWLEMWTTCRIRVINKARQWEPDLINEVSTNEKLPSPSFERMYTTIYSLHTFYISPRFIS